MLEAIRKQAYRLALPTSWRIHSTFHVSKLEPYHARDRTLLDEYPLAELVEDEEQYEVEEVLSKTKRKGEIQYLVKWKGWPTEYNQWVAEADMGNADILVREYEQSKKQARRKRSN